MIINVGEHKCTIDKTPVNELEVNVTKIQFVFSNKIPNNYVKKAFFTLGNVSKEVLILNNECDIPNEVLVDKGQVRVGVIAYEVQDDELIQRFNPSPCYFETWEGSMVDADNTEPITPTDKEQIEQAITDLENNKQDTLVSGENIKTINNESLLGSGNLEVITDLSDYYTKEEIDNKGYINKDVDDLTNYTKTSDLSEVATSGSYNDLEDTPNLSVYATNQALNNEISNRQNSDVALQSQIDAITSASDVTDVVGTYQDLLDYDTSKLTEKDIIKVLQDSTHNNALAYYRWENNSWEYIGSEGPFYTKGETDELLNQKANASTTYTKTETDNLLSNKVGFTDYATDSTGGVFKTANSYGTEMESGKIRAKVRSYADYTSANNSLFISKGTLENVITGKELVNQTTLNNSQALQDNEISDLKSENDYLNSIINQLPKVSSQGTILTLNNTINGRMNIELGTSELEQETTTGTQLIDFNNLTLVNVTCTFQNNILNLSSTGTFRHADYYITDLYKANPNKVLKFVYESIDLTQFSSSNATVVQMKVTNNGSNSYTTLLNSSKVSSEHTVLSDTSNVTEVVVQIFTNNSSTSSTSALSITKPMLQFGTETKTYEPFTGRIPAPNPSFPMLIHTISGNNTILINNTNIIGLDTNQYKINLKAGDKITAKNNTNATLTIQLFTNYGDTTRNDYWTLSANAQRTITLTADSKAINWQYAPNGIAWINLGDTLLPYEPYASQEANINLGDIEYCEIGDYKDEFVRSSGKNLFDKDNVNVLNAYIDSTNGNIGNDNNARTIYIPCKANTSYTISKIVSPRFIVGLTSTLPANGVTCLSFKRDDNATHLTLEGNANAKYIVVYLTNNYDSDIWNNIINSLMINEGSTALPYEPYGIGNWGIRKNIGKVVLDGTEDYVKRSDIPNLTNTSCYRTSIDATINSNALANTPQVCTRFTCLNNTNDEEHVRYTGAENYRFQIFINKTRLGTDDASGMKNWATNNNFTIYYVLSTPTYTQITGDLAEELENIYQYLLSYKGQTNISQINNDLPFNISANALLDLNTLVGE